MTLKFHLNVGLSPCPNDTFMMHDWLSNSLEYELKLQPHFHDIQKLNQLAIEGHFPLIKVSAALFPQICSYYDLLPIGMAMGYNCGPKLISKKTWSLNQIQDSRIIFPGKNTSAYQLFSQFFPKPKQEIFLPYHMLCEPVCVSDAEACVIIHETRFTFEKLGLIEQADLGKLWFDKTHMPLPLGIWVLRNDFRHLKEQIVLSFSNSLNKASKGNLDLQKFVLDYAQEKNWQIAEKHIDLYVNEFSKQSNPISLQAINLFCQLPCPV